jgi:hypothetical protein
MAQQSLTAPERETVINFSDADDPAHVWTAQRPVITRLRANPAAELVKEGRIGSTPWAEFRLPAKLVSFRSVSTKRNLTPDQRAAAGARLARARQAKAG